MDAPEGLLRPLAIGPLALESNLILAPLHHLTHRAMRRPARRYGAALAHTEMAAPEALVRAPKVADEVLATSPDDHPLSVQLVPGDAPTLVEAIALVRERGVAEALDLNFACPSRRLTGDNRGAAFLREPETAGHLVETAVRAARPLPVTLKCRVGWTHDPQDRALALETARAGVGAGAVAVTVHGRSAQQQYAGRADWATVGEWVQALPVPVLGSGDLRSPESVLAMLRETGAAGASIARGAIGAPWIFRQVRELADRGSYAPPSMRERREAILEHFADFVDQFGEVGAVRLMRKIGQTYARGFAGARRARVALQRIQTREDFEYAVDAHFT